MKKLLISTVIACGLLLLDAPEAAAHDKRDRQHSSPRADDSDKNRHDSYGRRSYRRHDYTSKYKGVNRMPRWFRHDRSFRRWFEYSRLRRDHWLS